MSDSDYPYWRSDELKSTPKPKVEVIGEDVIFENQAYQSTYTAYFR